MTGPVQIIVDQGDLLQANAALTKLQAEQFIRPELPGYLKSVMTVAEVYPPQFAGARYERTGHLKGSWAKEMGYPDARVRNLADYAGWVLARNPRHYKKAAGRPGKDPRKSMSMLWKVEKGNAWPEVPRIMRDKMTDWIDYMEHKAFKLWER